MRKLIKSILLEDGVKNLKIRSRGNNHCESANCFYLSYFEITNFMIAMFSFCIALSKLV